MIPFRAETEVSKASGERPAGSVLLIIPVPPSVNSMYRNLYGKGRVKTGVYAAWITEAGYRVRAQKPIAIPGKVRVDLTVKRIPNSDIDNRIKAVHDLLQGLSIIENDKFVEEVTARWSDEITEAVVIVEAV